MRFKGFQGGFRKLDKDSECFKNVKGKFPEVLKRFRCN